MGEVLRFFIPDAAVFLPAGDQNQEPIDRVALLRDAGNVWRAVRLRDRKQIGSYESVGEAMICVMAWQAWNPARFEVTVPLRDREALLEDLPDHIQTVADAGQWLYDCLGSEDQAVQKGA